MSEFLPPVVVRTGGSALGLSERLIQETSRFHLVSTEGFSNPWGVRTMPVRIKQCQIALSFWVASVAWLIFGPEQPGIHRTILAGAITLTVLACIERRATKRDLTLRLGYWNGRGERDLLDP